MRWVVGDIHGMLRPLRALVDAVTQRDAAARLLFVGDYVNRGPDSLEGLFLTRNRFEDFVLGDAEFGKLFIEALQQVFRMFLQGGIKRQILDCLLGGLVSTEACPFEKAALRSHVGHLHVALGLSEPVP